MSLYTVANFTLEEFSFTLSFVWNKVVFAMYQYCDDELGAALAAETDCTGEAGVAAFYINILLPEKHLATFDLSIFMD